MKFLHAFIQNPYQWLMTEPEQSVQTEMWIALILVSIAIAGSWHSGFGVWLIWVLGTMSGLALITFFHAVVLDFTGQVFHLNANSYKLFQRLIIGWLPITLCVPLRILNGTITHPAIYSLSMLLGFVIAGFIISLHIRAIQGLYAISWRRGLIIYFAPLFIVTTIFAIVVLGISLWMAIFSLLH